VKQVRESSELYSAYAPAVLERYVRQSVMPYIRALEPEYRSGGRAKGELVVASEVITYFDLLMLNYHWERTEEEEFAQLDKLSAEMGYEVSRSWMQAGYDVSRDWMQAALPAKKGKKGKKAGKVVRK
jgi:hypothetical protein